MSDEYNIEAFIPKEEYYRVLRWVRAEGRKTFDFEKKGYFDKKRGAA